MPAGTTVTPARLAAVRGDLRDHLRRRDAERARQARRRAHRGLHGLRDGPGARVVGGEAAEVEIALVEPGALDARDDLAHRSPDGVRVLAVERVARPDEDGGRAASQRLCAAHRRADPEPARDVVRGRDDPAAARIAADDERTGPELRLLELLHRGEEGVQVEVGENRHGVNLRSEHDRLVLDAPALPPPAIVAPAPREVSFGLVAGTGPARDAAGHRPRRDLLAADEPLRGRSFSLNVRLTPGATRIRVTAVDGRNRRSSRVVESVYGLPPGAEPRARTPRARRRPRTAASACSRAATAARAASMSRTCAQAAAPPGMPAPVSRPGRR